MSSCSNEGIGRLTAPGHPGLEQWVVELQRFRRLEVVLSARAELPGTVGDDCRLRQL